MFFCQSIHPKQVISLYLSEELMPEQIQLFQQYFPCFSNQFLSLNKLKFIDTSTILPSLPPTLSSLSIKTYLKTNQTDQLILRILQQQNEQLTSLELDGSYAFRSIDKSFPSLTHLILHYCTVSEFNRILQRIQSPLISLKIFLDKEDNFLLPKFHQLAKTLTNLNLSFCEGKATNIIDRPTAFVRIFRIDSILWTTHRLHLQITQTSISNHSSNRAIRSFQWSNLGKTTCLELQSKPFILN